MGSTISGRVPAGRPVLVDQKGRGNSALCDVWKIGEPGNQAFIDLVKRKAPGAFTAESEYELAELVALLAIENFGC